MNWLTRFYRSYLRSLFIYIGIHRTIEDIYWKIKLRKSSGMATHSISNTEAKFHIKNTKEIRRFNKLRDERPIIADLLSEVNKDDVVYDIGANIGMYTCFLARQLPPEQVVAFEPHPANIKRLRSNLDLNNVNATIVELALSDTSGTTELAIKSQEAGEGEHSIATDDDGETIPVELATGDELVDSGDLPPPSIIKIDVEGAEFEVLRGLKKMIANPECRLCYIEIHPNRLTDYSNSVEEINEFFISNGFELNQIEERTNEYFIKATK